jgi:hypothetical protein
MGADADCDGFLASVEVKEARQLSGRDEIHELLLEAANRAHTAIRENELGSGQVHWTALRADGKTLTRSNRPASIRPFQRPSPMQSLRFEAQ